MEFQQEAAEAGLLSFFLLFLMSRFKKKKQTKNTKLYLLFQ